MVGQCWYFDHSSMRPHATNNSRTFIITSSVSFPLGQALAHDGESESSQLPQSLRTNVHGCPPPPGLVVWFSMGGGHPSALGCGMTWGWCLNQLSNASRGW